MSGKSSRDHEKKDGALFILALFAIIVIGFSFMFWEVAGDKVVDLMVPAVLFMGKMWKLLGDPGQATYLGLMDQAIVLAANPKEVGLMDWIGFYNACLQPFSFLVAIPLILLTLWLSKNKKKSILMRRFKAEELMAEQAKYFTGILPVIKIRKDIVQDKNPLWRRQVTPEEIFLNYKGGKNGKMPMSTSDTFNNDVAVEYFQQLKYDKNRLVRSGMLGRLVVDLINDSRNYKNIVFSDRFSPEGKVLYAMFTAVAFGGSKGRDEFFKYRDLLNRSAYGTKDGMANLTVAQPLYEKYRKHEGARKVFGVHHWEYSVLFALLTLAQKKGRFTTAELLWLRPTNRVLFFSLNTCGAFTPHTEAAQVFAQFDYERRVARMGRIPIVDGKPVIFSDNCVRGMHKEWAHWMESSDDVSDDYDMSLEDLFSGKLPSSKISPEFHQSFEMMNAQPGPPPAALLEDTAFDKGLAAP